MNNFVCVTGNLGRDAEFKTVGSGKSLTKLSIGVNTGTKENPHTTWVKVTCWEEVADSASGLLKGDRVTVVGRLKQEDWESKGEKKSMLTVVANSVSHTQKKAGKGEDDSDIPF